jgi:hypothetical protein
MNKKNIEGSYKKYSHGNKLVIPVNNVAVKNILEG